MMKNDLANGSQLNCPDPGVYYDIPFETYLSWDAVSNSRLKLAERSLLHYKAGLDLPETKALRLGSLTHAGQLEPLAIAERYAVMPAYERDEENKTKGGDRSFSKSTVYFRTKEDEFIKANQGKRIVEASEYAEMKGIVKALTMNPMAVEAVGGDGDVEVSIVWDDPETGLRCKGRFDRVKSNLFGDLKTTRDASKFEKFIIDLSYHRQMAFYQDGWRVLHGETLEAHIAAIETSKPYASRAGRVCDQLLSEGLKEQKALLHKVAEAKSTNEWPGYENPSQWDGPEFYTRKRELREPVEATIGGKKVIF